MRQWVENLAEKIKTLNASSEYQRYLVIRDNAEFKVDTLHLYEDRCISTLCILFRFIDCKYNHIIKLYEDEYDLLKSAFDNRIKELDQQEINEFIDLCK